MARPPISKSISWEKPMTIAARLIERFDFDHRGAQIASDPDRHRRVSIIDEDPANVAAARQQVIRYLAGPGIEPPDAVRRFIDLPSLSVPVRHDVIWRFPWQRLLP